MRVIVFDSAPESKAALIGRVQEAIRQADLKRLEVVDVSGNLSEIDWNIVIGCFIGPGLFSEIDDAINKVRAVYPAGQLAIVLDQDKYMTEAVSLRKRLNTHVFSLSDLAQIASFLIDCESKGSGGSVGRNRGVIGVCQFKGGVGCTSVTVALGSCWARHGLSVAAIDLDDVSPQLTSWARLGVSQRAITSELLQLGEVPVARLNELVHPVEGFEGRFVVVGQPEAYNEGFHFKASVLEGSPSAGEFMRSLIGVIRAEFDVVIIDMARSWGVATFSCLPLCQHILLVTDDDGMSVKRTLDGIYRLRGESDDPEEFNLAKWSIVLNSYTGALISPKDLASEIQDMELFPSDANLWTIPFSALGRQWGAPGQSLYDICESNTKAEIKKIAHSLVPFKYEKEVGLSQKLMKKWQAIVNAS